MQKILVILLTLFVLGIHRVQTANETDFTVAVVEFRRSTNNTDNFEKYYEAINSTSNVHFIIFPESIFSKEAFEISKINVSLNCLAIDFITKIRCLAKERNTYVIINLLEKVACKKGEVGCPNSGQLIYNSDIVFGNNGSIMEKYRKWNLLGETNINKTSQLEIITIDTLKGKFGIMTSSDILFQQPTLNLTKLGVKNFILPSMWLSELPFLTALQTQQMWAYQNDVNLFSAGTNELSAGSGGSGIFLGKKGILNMTIAHDLKAGSYLMLTENVITSINETNPTVDEIDHIGKNLNNLTLHSDNLTDYASILINKTDSYFTKNLCDKTGKLCCIFNIAVKYNSSGSNQYIYRLVAYTGMKSFSGVSSGVEVCGIVSCTNDTTITSCSKRFPVYEDISWATTFENVTITANFKNTDSRIQFPNSLLSSIRPLSSQYFSWNRTASGNQAHVIYSLNKPQNRLLTFAIYGRNFTLDERTTPTKPNSVSGVAANSTLLLVTGLIVFCRIFK